MADPIGRSGALPPLGLLDLEKVKRESSGYPLHHPATTIHMPAPPMASPSTSTFSGPPPPYSYPSSASSSVVGGNNGTQSGQVPATYAPLHNHQARGDDKEHSYPTPRQSLPSINEALSIHSILTTNAPPRSSTIARSPTSPTHRPTVDTSRPPNDSYQPRSPRESKPYEAISRSSGPMYSSHAAHFAPSQSPVVNDSFSFFPTSQPPRALPDLAAYSRPSPSIIQQHPTTSSIESPITRHQPTTSASHSYAVPQPAFSYPPTTPAATSFQSPFGDDWRNGHSDQERQEGIRRAISKESPRSGRAYGESVKRHLDFFDLETSLNDIARGSGQTLEFSRRYGDSRHATQRSGPSSASLPTLTECDALIEQQKAVLNSMGRIRDIVLQQQLALAEQRHYDQQSYKHAPNDLQDGGDYDDKMDGVGGFAGSDAKKRRGRAAPPGRCHSCNRAETPEWRRGPDGARTLCNACGLHYAKLTRKMGNKAAAGSSNLRPKESSPPHQTYGRVISGEDEHMSVVSGRNDSAGAPGNAQQQSSAAAARQLEGSQGVKRSVQAAFEDAVRWTAQTDWSVAMEDDLNHTWESMFSGEELTALFAEPSSAPKQPASTSSGYSSKVRVLDRYKIVGFISSGTYGRVYKAVGHNGVQGEFAIKKFKPDKEGETIQYTGISQSAIREMALCSELSHSNIIALAEIILEDKCIFMVFEYCEHDLLQIIQHHSQPTRHPIPASMVKSILFQLLNGVHYLHTNWVLHRDLKPANIMVTSRGEVRIGDLGLARLFYKPLHSLFSGDKVVVTIWYRAPELLLGSRHYTPAVDLWAVGCIFAELLSLRPIFKGEEAKMDNKKTVPFQRNQMQKIVEIIGMPTKERWGGLVSQPEYSQLQTLSVAAREGNPGLKNANGVPIGLESWYWNTLRATGYNCDGSHGDTSGAAAAAGGGGGNDPGSPGAQGLDLLSHLLDYDPTRRLTAAQAMEHPYFKSTGDGSGEVNANCFADLPPNVTYPQRRVSQDDNDIRTQSLPGTKRGGLPDDTMMGGMSGALGKDGAGARGLKRVRE
ncbi:uncharacterized protein KY384_008140 [Bacidia gigantensis]|uniref:uncharacterized protein n=1 Tax=Bacidia gigantensis TaxID=2732470 RepID=UPI001D03A0E5|nr:uncharacterized protein KY384_008140 [Bacidia gigantensis]KAG8526711.1 hypothetical protein KY384_008140 [Bacidia gigantensis]